MRVGWFELRTKVEYIHTENSYYTKQNKRMETERKQERYI